MVLTARFREYSRIFSRLEWVVVEDVVLFFKVPYTHSCYSLADMLWNAWMSLLLMNVLLINVCALHIRSLSISGPCGHWHGGKGVFSIALGMPRNQSTTEFTTREFSSPTKIIGHIREATSPLNCAITMLERGGRGG